MSDKFEQDIEHLDEDRRAALKKMVRSTAFVVPTVATFSLGLGMTTKPAYAANS